MWPRTEEESTTPDKKDKKNKKFTSKQNEDYQNISGHWFQIRVANFWRKFCYEEMTVAKSHISWCRLEFGWKKVENFRYTLYIEPSNVKACSYLYLNHFKHCWPKIIKFVRWTEYQTERNEINFQVKFLVQKQSPTDAVRFLSYKGKDVLKS